MRTTRPTLAIVIIALAIGGISALAVFIVWDGSPEDNKLVFTALVPVFSSWVGTILAFYFGRESFESANEQVRKMNEQFRKYVGSTVQDRIAQNVTEIMRPISDMTYYQFAQGQDESGITLAQLQQHFGTDLSRFPILNAAMHPLYMIHRSVIDRYAQSGGDTNHTLREFLDAQAQQGQGYDFQRGYVIVAETASVGDAKAAMEAIQSAQDVFVTAEGTRDELLLGWVSNTRLTRHLQA